jgi:sigma-B regulation protein RsbU (phosphoserine phosphatase)
MVKALNSDASAGPEKLLKNVRNAVNDFVKDAEQFDDLTMLCLEYLGSPKTDGPDDHTRET